MYLYEDFKADNESVYYNILSFLGVAPADRAPAFEHHNRSVKVKLKSAQNFAYDISHGNGLYAPVHAAVKAVMPQPVRRFLTRSIYQTLAFKPKPKLSDKVRQELKCRFKPQVERFSQVLERDLVTRGSTIILKGDRTLAITCETFRACRELTPVLSSAYRVSKMKIGHYAPRIGAQGGIATYIRRLGAAQVEAGHSVVYVGVDHERTGDLPEDAFQPLESPDGLFKLAECLELDVLHLHRSVPEIPSDRVLTVRTMHGHQAGCPSASRYLSRPGVPCDRPYTVGGCLWGHIVDRCGSVRPKELIGNFRRIHHQIAQVSKIPTYTVSQFLREKMIQAGCERANLETIASPAPPVKGEFTPVPDDPLPRFLYLGRLVPQKGLDWLLRAVAATPHALHLDVAGEGPERDALQPWPKRCALNPV